MWHLQLIRCCRRRTTHHRSRLLQRFAASVSFGSIGRVGRRPVSGVAVPDLATRARRRKLTTAADRGGRPESRQVCGPSSRRARYLSRIGPHCHRRPPRPRGSPRQARLRDARGVPGGIRRCFVAPTARGPETYRWLLVSAGFATGKRRVTRHATPNKTRWRGTQQEASQ